MPDHIMSDSPYTTPANDGHSSDFGLKRLKKVLRSGSPDTAAVMENSVLKRKVMLGLALGGHERQRFGRYVIMGVLGRGGMGTVLEAYDAELDRPVALKILNSRVSGKESRRLVREAQALARLDHPNVVKVFEVGMVGEQTFIAMQLVDGITLAEWQAQTPGHDWKECLEVYLQAGDGLAAAHEAGLVHRDFKPQNCIIDRRGRVRILDFGLVQSAGGTELVVDKNTRSTDMEVSLRPHDNALDVSLTRTGASLGTPAYMPPEQFEGRSVNALSDQFCFCMSLWEALYGKRPGDAQRRNIRIGEATSFREALYADWFEPRIQRPTLSKGIPTEIYEILNRGLATDPSDRWPSIEALLELLRAIAYPKRRFFAPLWIMGATFVAFAIAGGQRYAEVMERCTGADEQFDHVWNDSIQERVRSIDLADNDSEAWTSVDRDIAGFVSRWKLKYTQVCQATVIRKEQSEEVRDARMRCLHDQRAWLESKLAALVSRDRGRGAPIGMVVSRLPNPEKCNVVPGRRRDRYPMPLGYMELD